MPKTFFVSETLVGVIVVEVGRVFCQDDCGVFIDLHYASVCLYCGLRVCSQTNKLK